MDVLSDELKSWGKKCTILESFHPNSVLSGCYAGAKFEASELLLCHELIIGTGFFGGKGTLGVREIKALEECIRLDKVVVSGVKTHRHIIFLGSFVNRDSVAYVNLLDV